MRGNGEDELIREAPQRGPQSVAALQRQLMEHEFLILHSSDWPMPRNLSKMEASVHQLEKRERTARVWLLLPVCLCLWHSKSSIPLPCQLSCGLKGRCFTASSLTLAGTWEQNWQLAGSFIGHSRKLVSNAAQSI